MDADRRAKLKALVSERYRLYREDDAQGSMTNKRARKAHQALISHVNANDADLCLEAMALLAYVDELEQRIAVHDDTLEAAGTALELHRIMEHAAYIGEPMTGAEAAKKLAEIRRGAGPRRKVKR